MTGRSRRTLRLIGVLKLLKGLALLVAGIGLLSLFHRDAAETVSHWIEAIRVDPHDRFIAPFLGRIAGVNPSTLHQLGGGTLLYAAVFCTEGVGLLLELRWAEYMTAGVTASFLPIEVYEAAVHPSAVKVAVILINVAVVAYLVLEIRNERALRQLQLGAPKHPGPTTGSSLGASATPRTETDRAARNPS